MSVAEKLVERRKHNRFSVSKGAFVALRPHYGKIGQVVNISMGGLAFTYMADEERPSRSFELDIFLAGGSFYLQEVPFGTISDFHNDGMPLSSVKMRQRRNASQFCKNETNECAIWRPNPPSSVSAGIFHSETYRRGGDLGTKPIVDCQKAEQVWHRLNLVQGDARGTSASARTEGNH